MKKFLSKKPVAIVLCLLIVLGSTLLNTRIRLGGACRELTNSFYAAGSMADQLGQACTEGETMAALAEANGVDASSLRYRIESLRGMLNREEDNASQLYSGYMWLREELSLTRQQLFSASLNETDASQLRAVTDRLSALQSAISSSDYNAQVRSFETKNSSLLTRVLARFSGVNMPVEFA